MRARVLRLLVPLLMLPLIAPPVAAMPASPVTDAGCDVTLPNDKTAPGEQGDLQWYGSGAPDASLWLMNLQPVIRLSAYFDPHDEGGHSIKTPFWRGESSGPVSLTGERLDGPVIQPPHIDAAWNSYEMPGFIATGIWLPTGGCWKLTATDGNDTLTWTVLAMSPFADCQVTSGADDDGTLPRGAGESVITGRRGTPTAVILPAPDDHYGKDGLYITPGDPIRHFPYEGDLVSPDGAISDKFVWYRQGHAEGKLSITVENTTQWFPDEPEINIPEGYGNSGVQASGITFSSPGCWQVTGTSGEASITFTVRLDIVPARD